MAYPFIIPGIDLSMIPDIVDDDCGLTKEVSAAQLTQLVASAFFGSHIGGIWRSTSPPPVATDPRFKDFLWLDMSTTPPIFRWYYETLHSWDPYSFPPGSISGSSFFDYSIPVIKLATGGLGNANKIIVVNATGQAFIFAFAKDVIADNTLPISRLEVPANTPGKAYLVHQGGGVKAWATLTAADFLAFITPGSITLDKIGQSGANTGDRPEWNGTAWVPTPLASGGPVIPTPTVGDNGEYLTVVAGAYALTGLILPAAVQNFKSATSGLYVVPFVQGGNITFNHGLGGVPTFFEVRLRCKTAHGGYSVGDEVDALSLTASPLDAKKCWMAYANVTKIYVFATDGASGCDLPQPLGSVASTGIVSANWEMKIYAQIA